VSAPTDRRVAAVLGWTVALLFFFLAVARAADLRYLSSDRWPTDIYAFNHLDTGPLDVVSTGSSRTAFGLPPSGLALCLERELGRPVNTANLGRYFASVVGQSIVARDVLADRPPKVLTVEVSPGLANDYYNLLYIDIGENGRLADTGACLGAARDARTLVSCARPLLRGVENLSWGVVDLLRAEERETTWMMTYMGGGQWCFGDPACRRHNQAYGKVMDRHWKRRVEQMVPTIARDRFARFQVGEGIAHDYLSALADWAEDSGVALVLINMPVHGLYQDEIPEEDYEAFLAYIEGFAEERGAVFFDANGPRWWSNRGAFFDPDHLNSKGARQVSQEVCRQAIAPLLREP
jgi:hypothetical protein